jgi:hypothetical protein
MLLTSVVIETTEADYLDCIYDSQTIKKDVGINVKNSISHGVIPNSFVDNA